VNLEAAGTAQSGYKGPSIYATKSGKTDKLGDLPEQVGPTQQYESIEVTWENGLAPIKCTWDANTNKLETENMPLTTVLDNLGI
jgi:hypothetical protein